MLSDAAVFASLATFAGLMVAAAVSDLRTMTIPNSLSLAVCAGFLAFAPVSGVTLGEFGWHLAAGAAVLAVCFFMFAMNWLGGGDAKLFAAAALWFGAGHVLEFVVAAVLCGGALTLGILLGRSLPLPIPVYGWSLTANLLDRTKGIPYGVAIATGALIVLPMTPAWRGLFGG